MHRIFLSYRRDDTQGEAAHLFENLTAHFGVGNVFMDVAGIEPGRDFRKVIDHNVAGCAILLAMIGRGWIDAKDDAGRRRLDDPLDFVRIETAAALKRDIPVIPVLVQGGRMPRPEQLSEDLRDLAYRNAVELTHGRWSFDVQVLIKALHPHVEEQQEEVNVKTQPPHDLPLRESVAPNSDEMKVDSTRSAVPPARSWGGMTALRKNPEVREDQEVRRKSETRDRWLRAGAARMLWVAISLGLLALPTWYFTHRQSAPPGPMAGRSTTEVSETLHRSSESSPLTVQNADRNATAEEPPGNGKASPPPALTASRSSTGEAKAPSLGNGKSSVPPTAKVDHGVSRVSKGLVLASGKDLLTLRGHNDFVLSVAWRPDGQRLLTGSADHSAKVWNTETGRELRALLAHEDPVYTVAWSPDGKRLVTGSRDDTAKVWDAENGKELITVRGHRDNVNSVAWSPSGKRFATGSTDNTAKIWDAENGKEFLTLRGHSEPVRAVAYSPDGKRLATAGDDHTAKVWDAEAGKEFLALRGHSGAVFSVAWSPDGKWLATGSTDKTAKVWDAENGKELLTLRGHTGFVQSVAWSPDGELATESRDGTAKVWDVGRVQGP